MELIKQRKHTWISSLDKRMRQVRGGELATIPGLTECSQQQRDPQPETATHDNGSLCYEEHNGVIEIGVDAKIVPTYSFEEIRNQIEEKWKEEIKTKMAEVRVFF